MSQIPVPGAVAEYNLSADHVDRLRQAELEEAWELERPDVPLAAPVEESAPVSNDGRGLADQLREDRA